MSRLWELAHAACGTWRRLLEKRSPRSVFSTVLCSGKLISPPKNTTHHHQQPVFLDYIGPFQAQTIGSFQDHKNNRPRCGFSSHPQPCNHNQRSTSWPPSHNSTTTPSSIRTFPALAAGKISSRDMRLKFTGKINTMPPPKSGSINNLAVASASVATTTSTECYNMHSLAHLRRVGPKSVSRVITSPPSRSPVADLFSRPALPQRTTHVQNTTLLYPIGPSSASIAIPVAARSNSSNPSSSTNPAPRQLAIAAKSVSPISWNSVPAAGPNFVEKQTSRFSSRPPS